MYTIGSAMKIDDLISKGLIMDNIGHYTVGYLPGYAGDTMFPWVSSENFNSKAHFPLVSTDGSTKSLNDEFCD